MLPHRSLQSLSHQYGELMMLCLGSKPVLIVSSANAAHEVMKTNDLIFSDRPPRAIFKRLLYGCKDVASAPYGDHWKQMRSICVLQLLSNKRVQSFCEVIEEEIGLLMKKIERSSSSGVNLGELFTTYTSNLVCRVAFGRKYEGEEGGTHFKRLIEEWSELLGGFHVGDFIPWLGWIDRLSGLDARTHKVAKEFDKFLERIVQEHSDRLSGGSAEKSGEADKIKDVVDVLLELQKSDTFSFQIDNDSIKAFVLDMFVGGTETSSTLLEWAMTELLRHPKAMELVQEEVRAVARGKEGITKNDLEKMDYLKAVIKETLRLHPPLPLLFPRMSTQDVKLNGYLIPAQTQVIFNAWAIQRDPTFWEEPEEFRPERFLKNPVDFRGQDFHFIPFGAGRRACPGSYFAISSIEPALAKLIHKFNWGLPGGAKSEALDIDEHPGITVHRQPPLFAVATPCYC